MVRGKLLVRGAVGVTIVLVAWAAYASSRQIERNKRIEEEVASLQAEADKIRRENGTLSEKIGYFSSSSFQEQEAKKKLGLRKADEKVAVIKPQVGTEERKKAGSFGPTAGGPAESDVAPASDAREGSDLPNYRKWWDRFFQTLTDFHETGNDL